MKTVLLANPKAAAGKVARRMPVFERAVSEVFGECESLLSEAPGEVEQLTRRCVEEGASRLVVVGGDGTVNEAVNGLMDPSTGQLFKDLPEMVFLPAGTGGDFARSIGTSTATIEEVLTTGEPRPVDLGVAQLVEEGGREISRYFINEASAGVSSAIAERVNKGSKRLGGRLSFALATLTTLATWKDMRVRLRIDDDFDEELNLSAVVVCNGRFFGGGMMIGPHALVDDGLFDIVIMEELGAFKFMSNSRKVYRGDHLKVDGIGMRRGKVVRVDPLEDKRMVPVELEGDQPGFAPWECRLLPGALQVRAPWTDAVASSLFEQA